MDRTVEGPFERLTAGRSSEGQGDAAASFEVLWQGKPLRIIVSYVVSDNVVVVKRDAAARLDVQGPRDECVVPHHGSRVGPASAVEMQPRTKYPIPPLCRLQVADGAGKGILRRRVVGPIGPVGDILPFTIPIGTIVDAKTLLFTHTNRVGVAAGSF